MKRVPFYLSQKQLHDLAQLLYTGQHITNVVHGLVPIGDQHAPDLHFQLLSDLRKQCCLRSGATDPFPELPLAPSAFDEPGAA